MAQEENRCKPPSTIPYLGGWMKLMIAGDVVKARKRMRNAGFFAFVSAGILSIGALMSFGGVDAEGTPLISGWQFSFVMAEAGLTAALACGVLKRMRVAAVLLFFGFFVIKTAAFFFGVGKPGVLLLHLVIFGYLFFQGMRGAFTFHYLTHPPRLIPTSASPLHPDQQQQHSGEAEEPESGTDS